MRSSQIRRKFLDYFIARGHTDVTSSSLVPADDPTLLFTNAGMVQFKRTFLGQDPRPYVRATTCQRCVRAGGKHNDLEQVGSTKRHGTFFEMLGNFSFGDYFKREAIQFAWEFVTSPEYLGLSPDQLRVTVLHSDAEARQLWLDHTSLPADRIYGLSEKDNFWQMADTGPCGPSSEIFVDLEWKPGVAPPLLSREEFEALTESQRFIEIWNLVFMQFDRGADGVLTPLPRPSVDTGAGLDRIASVLQSGGDIFHCDLLRPLISVVEELAGKRYPGGPQGDGVSFRALADHARSVSFLLMDGVFPGNEGRGFVVRRILRRAVRHAWLLGRREPTLARLVPTLVEIMGEAYPELRRQQAKITEIIEREEENFHDTIDAGLERLEQIRASGSRRISGEDAFRLFDTFGFPIDLTELIASEWGIEVDVTGFDAAMKEQRTRSRSARTAGRPAVAANAPQLALATGALQHFVGYETLDATTSVLGGALDGTRGTMLLRDSPFYAGGGGQVPDTGTIEGEGWTLHVDDIVRDAEKRAMVVGRFEGRWPGPGAPATARVDIARRADIERNHSATHLVHMVLRRALGDHVRQQGSLVEPRRLRFDFSHHGPIDQAQLDDIESAVNELILANAEANIREMPLDKALGLGAMAFFADKYGDVVRVVQLGESIELCGGTHVRSAGQVGPFRFTSQGGVAAGVRRIEAVTGHAAHEVLRQVDQRIAALATALRANPDQLERKLEGLLAERERLEARLAEALRTGPVTEEKFDAGSVQLFVSPTVTEERGQLGMIADEFRGKKGSGSMLVLYNPTSPAAIAVAVTDDLAARGKDASSFVKLVTARFGGRGGGRPTFASGTLGVPSVQDVATREFPAILRAWADE